MIPYEELDEPGEEEEGGCTARSPLWSPPQPPPPLSSLPAEETGGSEGKGRG